MKILGTSTKYISYLKLRYTNGWVGSDDAGARFLYEATMGGAQDYYLVIGVVLEDGRFILMVPMLLGQIT